MKMTQECKVGTKLLGFLPYVLILAGIALLVVGIRNGEVMTIWRKATMICMECIGIG